MGVSNDKLSNHMNPIVHIKRKKTTPQRRFFMLPVFSIQVNK
jgi:hypothetical protein